MSGGHYGYVDHYIEQLAENIESDLKGEYCAEEPPEILEQMELVRRMAATLAEAAHSLDLFMSSDTGNDTFLKDMDHILKHCGLRIEAVPYLPLPTGEDNRGSLFPVAVFHDMVMAGAIIDEDGTGFFAYPQGVDESCPVVLKREKTYYPPNATHVEWYNR